MAVARRLRDENCLSHGGGINTFNPHVNYEGH